MQFSKVSLLVVLACLMISSVFSTIIVVDEYGSEVGLPTMGGQATGGFTINNAIFPLNMYNITVFISNEKVHYDGITTNQRQSFYVLPSYGEASLVNSYFQAGTLDGNTNKVVYSAPIVAGNYVASANAQNSAVGRYVYQFSIPHNQALKAKIIFSNTGNPTVTDYISVNVANNHA